jgi:hypothetical protein
MCDEDSRGYVNKKSFKVKGVTRTLRCIVFFKKGGNVMEEGKSNNDLS